MGKKTEEEEEKEIENHGAKYGVLEPFHCPAIRKGKQRRREQPVPAGESFAG